MKGEGIKLTPSQKKLFSKNPTLLGLIYLDNNKEK